MNCPRCNNPISYSLIDEDDRIYVQAFCLWCNLVGTKAETREQAEKNICGQEKKLTIG